MIKKEIAVGRNKTVYLEYDNKEYDIEYVENKNVFILRRLKDNKVLEILSDKIGFIVQVNSYGVSNFVTTEYSEDKEEIKFKHYIDRSSWDEFKLMNQIVCDNIFISSRVSDNSYIVEQNGYSGSVYCLNGSMRKYDHIYNDKRINEIIGDNVLMVSKVKRALGDSSLTDTITYGINPENFEIVTPIWSELQQRSIVVDKYSEDKERELRKKLFGENSYVAITCQEDLDNRAIYVEVQHYLNELSRHLNRTDKVYKDVMEDEVNIDFIKKFVRK